MACHKLSRAVVTIRRSGHWRGASRTTTENKLKGPQNHHSSLFRKVTWMDLYIPTSAYKNARPGTLSEMGYLFLVIVHMLFSW